MLSLTNIDAGERRWPAIATWALGWVALQLLDGRVDLANLAMLLVLTSAVASLWLSAWLSVLAGAAAVMAFNWTFVPPRGTFAVDLRQHALLLGAMLLVNTIIAALMAAQRRAAQRAERQTVWTEQMRGWGDTLRDAAEPLAHAGALHTALAAVSKGPVALLALKGRAPSAQEPNEAATSMLVGETDADQLAGLWHCLRQGQPMGPGTGRHEELSDWYLPLRGRGVTLGAAVLRGLGAPSRADPDLRVHAQALCDQFGLALQRAQASRDEQQAPRPARARRSTQPVRRCPRSWGSRVAAGASQDVPLSP